MKALVYHGPGKRAWEETPRPAIQSATDAIVRITTSATCGTDLHILKRDLPGDEEAFHTERYPADRLRVRRSERSGEAGDTVASVGADPIGRAVLLTAQFYSPAGVLIIDQDDNRLRVAKDFGATTVINSADDNPVERVMEVTGAGGVDVAVEAVGIRGRAYQSALWFRVLLTCILNGTLTQNVTVCA